jgi:molybdopterin-guanine dinucleotide biosynthesis protein MobB
MSQPPEGLPVLAICGFSGSGKTTLIEAVVPVLGELEITVAVVKHDAHGVQLDTPGKDSDRLFKAGADVVLRGANESAVRWHPDRAPDLDQSLAQLAVSHDLVLVEGHKNTALQKLWLLREGETEPPAGITGIRKVLALDPERLPTTLDVISHVLDEGWRRRPVHAGILIGGGSSRMGRPKQLVEHDGSSLVERVAGTLEQRLGTPVLLGSGPVPDPLAQNPRLADPPGVRGPIAGLLAALRWDPGAAWLVAACDLPLMTPEAVDWLLAQRRPGRWAVLPQLPDGPPEPFLAVYEPLALQLLERLAVSEKPAPRLLGRHHRVVRPAPPPEISGCWYNVNTPEDLEGLGR